MRKKNTLDMRIEEVELFLEGKAPNSEEYTIASKNLNTLYDARSTKRPAINTDTLVLGAISLLELVLVLNFEKGDIIVSKAFNWVKRAL